MISRAELGALRFADFLPAGQELFVEDGYEWMDAIWHYEGIGFSWFGSQEEESDMTSCMELFADEVSAEVMGKIMERLGMPLSFGMGRSAIEDVFGKPFNTQNFADDRETFEFLTTGPEPYYLSCTVLHDGGLAFFSLMRGDLYQLR